MSRLFRLLTICIFLPWSPLSSADDHIQKIAFGSCLGQTEPQPIWNAVLAEAPDLWIWGGDNVYSDTEDMAKMAADWRTLLEQPGYRKLRESGIPIMGTWDDHDYGANDAGANYPQREASQQLFLDFLGVDAASPRRNRGGVYHARVFGDSGRRVQVIVLDTRYHRSDIQSYPKLRPDQERVYYPVQDRDATILGEAQWAWLEAQLQRPADLRLIVTSIQAVSEEHRFEKWSNFPRERRRLLNLINDTGAEGVVLLSGDRHHAELSMLDDSGAYPLYELTSSGLNKSRIWPGQADRPPEPNRYRLQGPYRGHHYGLLQIDWEQADPVITLEIRDTDNASPIAEQLLLSEISPSVAASLTTRIARLATTPGTEGSEVVVDGNTTDWPGSSLLAQDEDHYYLRFATDETRSLNRGGTSLEVRLDFANTDMDADLSVVFDPLREPGDRRWGPEIRVGAQPSASLTAADIGLQAAPSHASQWFELRLEKRALARAMGAAELTSDLTVTVTQTPHGGSSREIARSTLTSGGALSEASTTSGATLPTKPEDGLRVVSYNLLWGSHLKNPEAFARTFKALDADIYLFQEWSRERITTIEAADWFERNVDATRTWHAAVAGTAGSWHGTLVVSPHPISGSLPRFAPMDAGGWSFPMRVAGGLVDTPVGTVFAASAHLKASGHYNSPEDERRMAEADAINRLLTGASAASEAEYTVLGGDFNLNGSVAVLERATRMLDRDGSSLAVAEPTVLGDDALKATFGRPYPASRLDYIAYPDHRMRLVNSFVLNTGMLTPAVLDENGLRADDTQASDHYPVVLDLVPSALAPNY